MGASVVVYWRGDRTGEWSLHPEYDGGSDIRTETIGHILEAAFSQGQKSEWAPGDKVPRLHAAIYSRPIGGYVSTLSLQNSGNRSG